MQTIVVAGQLRCDCEKERFGQIGDGKCCSDGTYLRRTKFPPEPPLVAAGDAPVYIVGSGPLDGLDCGEAVAALTAARDDMPGSCVNDADAAVEAELGREIGSRVGGGRIWGPSSIAGRGRGQVLFEGCVKAGVACGRGAPRSS